MPVPDVMSQAEQQNAFTSDLEKLVTRYRDEFEMTVASFIGCLELVKADIMLEVLLTDEEEDE